MINAFWSISNLDLNDPINNAIWSNSPAEQDRIQPYRANWTAGDIGAQQSMRHPYRLPWVPDQVGRDWKSRNALFVFGSAYGPFIGGDGRSHEVRPADYAQATSGEFLEQFCQSVIRTRAYYARIASLVGPFISTCQMLSLVDLCRVAFVKREPSRDLGGDQIVNQAPELFSAYAESPAATEWHWLRLIASDASAIVALGTIAEHGLLRLFARRLRKVSIHDSLDEKISFKSINDNRWPSRYAHPSRKLKDRVASATPPYWQIQGDLPDGRKRIWRLAVVHHPTGCRTNSGDYQTRAIKAILNIAAAAKSSA